MSTSSVSSTLAAAYNNASSSTLQSAATSTTTSASDLQNQFLTMLMTELKNQDPTNPVDSTQMLAQEAQFSTLEQMENMNTNLVSLMAMQNTSQATNLIGHTVTGTVSGSTVTGTVSGVSFSSGSPVLQVNTGGSSTVSMNLSDITTVQ